MAKENNTEQKVTAILEPIAKEYGVTVVDVEFVKEGPNWYLRVYIDKDGGVSIDDCEQISRLLDKKMDETDPISQAYFLEVSSPGLDRPLKKEEDFVKYKGSLVDVKLYRPVMGSKEFQGTLEGRNEQKITIIDEQGQNLEFEQKDVASIRLAILF